MNLVSYAQNFEDVLIWRALKHVDCGRYIDIGAQDPEIDSVSRIFYEAGWRGVHVEPISFYASRLREARPDEIVLEAAVTDQAGPIPFFEIAETGISTGIQEIATLHSQAGYSHRKIHVPTTRLDQVFELVEGDIHWMKVDVEGMEANVLRSWGDSDRRPWLLVVESTLPNSQEPTHHVWIEELLSRGYGEVFFDGLSRYFLHENRGELASALSSPANVFDGFAIATSHFAAGILRRDLEEQAQNHAAELAHLQQENQRHELALEQRQRDLEEQAQNHAAELAQLQQEKQRHELALEQRHQQEVGRLLDVVGDAQQLAGGLREQLATAERDHRESLDALWRERVSVEAELHHEFRAREETLRKSLSESELDVAAKNVEIVRLQERAAHLLDEAANHHAVAARADSLIRRILAEPAGGWYRIGEALGLASRGPAWQALTRWSWQSLDGPSNRPLAYQNNEAVPTMQHPPETDRRNPYLRANSVLELLSWDDIDFVRCAYVTVLGRQPDPEGEAYYTNRIRRGDPKLEILSKLRRSAEGPNHDPGIAGLDRQLRRAAWQCSPCTGWIFRKVWPCADSVAPGERNFRATMNALARNRAAILHLAAKFDTVAPGAAQPGGAEASQPSSPPAAGAQTASTRQEAPGTEHLRMTCPLPLHVARNGA